MSVRYSAEDIPGALDRLIEAWLGLSPARRELEQYKLRNSPPQRHVDFNVEGLQDYHRRRLEYEAGLEDAKIKVETARQKYESAQEEVQTFLPESSRLLYEYQGERPDIKGERYIIQYRGSRFTVEPHTDAIREGAPWGAPWA